MDRIRSKDWRANLIRITQVHFDGPFPGRSPLGRFHSYNLKGINSHKNMHGTYTRTVEWKHFVKSGWSVYQVKLRSHKGSLQNWLSSYTGGTSELMFGAPIFGSSDPLLIWLFLWTRQHLIPSKFYPTEIKMCFERFVYVCIFQHLILCNFYCLLIHFYLGNVSTCW